MPTILAAIAAVAMSKGLYGLAAIALVGFWILCHERANPLGKE